MEAPTDTSSPAPSTATSTATSAGSSSTLRRVMAVVAVLAILAGVIVVASLDGEHRDGAAASGGTGATPTGAPGGPGAVALPDALPIDVTRPFGDDARRGTFLGALDDAPDVFVSITTDEGTLRAYVCDGATFGHWFSGPVLGSSFDLRHASGARLTGMIADGRAIGTYTGADGAVRSFTTALPLGSGGLFRAEATLDGGASVVGGWIVHDDGEVRGVSTVTDASGATTAPAPPIDAAQTRIEPTATLETGAVPVVEVTAEGLAGPVPTAASAPQQERPAGDVVQVALADEVTAPAPPSTPSAPPTLSAAFTPARLPAGARSRWVGTITNPGKEPLTGAGFPLAFPDPVVPVPGTAKLGCEGSAVEVDPKRRIPGDPQLVVVIPSLAPGARCEASVEVTVAAGAFRVVSGAPTADNATGPGAVAVAVVEATPAAAPSTTAASTTAPSTTAPSTAAPSTTAPSTTAPSTAAPSTAAPSTTAAPVTTAAPTPSATAAPVTTATATPSATAAPVTTAATVMPAAPATTAPPATVRPAPAAAPAPGPAVTLTATTQIGTSPLSVVITPAVPRGATVASWAFTFSDASIQARGTGALIPVPKTFVNESRAAVVMSADLQVDFVDGTVSRARITFDVLPRGAAARVLVADTTTPLTRGAPGTVAVRLVNGEPTPHTPRAIAFQATGLQSAAGPGWTCARLSCTAAPIPPGGQSSPLTLTFATVPLDAPATLVISHSGEVTGQIAVPVVGFRADAGPDQTVDAGTRVILDASRSTASVGGGPRTFTWRQTAGPTVTLLRDADPSGQRQLFDAPQVSATTTLTFEVTVTDGVTTARDAVSVRVLRLDRAPTIAVTATPAEQGGAVLPAASVREVRFEAAASDPDGDAVTVTWRVPGVTGAGLTADGSRAVLAWPVPGQASVTVEATATDALGRTSVDTVVVGTPPAPLTLAVGAPTTAPGGSVVRLTATPSRTAGVTVTWSQVSGDPVVFGTRTGLAVDATLPGTAGGPRTVVLRATATTTDGSAAVSADVSVVAAAAAPISIVLAPAQDVDAGDTVVLDATIVRPPGSTIRWTQLAGPPVTITTPTAARAGFTAPNADNVVIVRVAVSNGASTLTADQVITIGTPPPTTGTGCVAGSVLGRIFAGERVLLIGGSSTVMLGDVEGASGTCTAAVTLDHSGTDINLFGFITGDDLAGTIDSTKICFTAGTVRLASKFDLPDVEIGAIPLCLVYASAGGGPGASAFRPASFERPERTLACDFPMTGELRFPGDVPFVDLPAGITPGETVVAVECDLLRLTGSATFSGGGSLRIVGTVGVTGTGTATITADALSLFGGTVGGAITVDIGATAAISGSLEITDPDLPFGDGVQLDRLALVLEGGTVGLDGTITLGAADPRLQLRLSGDFAGRDRFDLAVTAASTAPWTPTPGLTVAGASITGTLAKDPNGISIDVTATASGTWQVLPSVAVRNVTLQVGNATPPQACTGIPAGSVFLRAGGTTDVSIPGRAPLTTQVDACVGLPGTRPSGGAAGSPPVFLLRSVSTMPPLQPNPAVDLSIQRVELRVAYVDGELEAALLGDAQVMGLSLSAKVLFRTAPGGDVLVVVATGNVAALGTPVQTGSVVFASSAVADLELDAGLVVDLPAGLSLVATIDLETSQRQLLNAVLKPPTPIAGTLVVSASLGGPDLVLTAAVDLGPNGIPLFTTCPTASAGPCQANATTTTLFRLDNAFVMLKVGASGFQVGFGGQGTLFLPPSENRAGAVRSELQLRAEAFFRPPAEFGISFSLISPSGWQHAAGIQGLTVNAMVVQGTLDVTVPTAPVPSIGMLAEVSRLPDPLANLIGFTNNGEPVRLALNIAPKNPIVEVTVGLPNGQAVMKPLRSIDGAATGLDDALTVDHASIVFAPLGGAIGPITYSPGVSLRFGATLVGTAIEVNATVDIAALRIIANISVGSFRIAGVDVDDTQLLLDIQPLGFRLRVTGGVVLPDGPSLSADVDIQAGVLAAISQSGAPAPSTTLPRPTAGISVVANLTAASWQIAPGTALSNVSLHGEGRLDALSASIDLVFGMRASATLMGRAMNLSGDARLAGGELREVHLRVNPGNVTLGGVTLGGDGTCQSSLVTAPAPAPVATFPIPGAPGGGRRPPVTGPTGPITTNPVITQPPAPIRVGTNGPCVQLDYVQDASPPVAVGIRGTLAAGTVTAQVVGTLDAQKANLQGTVALGELGSLPISGVLYHAPDAQLTSFRIRVKDETATVVPQQGSWRFDGRFAQGAALKGFSAPWNFSLGSVDPAGARARVTWAQLSGSVSRPGFEVVVKGEISFSGSTMRYHLVGTSALKVDESFLTINPNPDAFQAPAENALHGAIRPVVFTLDPSPPSGQQGLEQVRGRLYGSASYTLRIEIRHDAANVVQFSGVAEVLYAEAFKRNGATSFTEEARTSWNNPIDIGLEIDSTTGRACFRWGDPGDFATQVWGAC